MVQVSRRWSQRSRRHQAFLVGHTTGQLPPRFLQLFLGSLQLDVAGVQLGRQRYRTFRLVTGVLQQGPPLAFPLRVVLGAAHLRFPYSLLEVTDEIPQFLLLVLERRAQLLHLGQQVGLVRAELFALQLETCNLYFL